MASAQPPIVTGQPPPIPPSPSTSQQELSQESPKSKQLRELIVCHAEGGSVGLTLVVPIKINGLEIPAVVDTVAEATILSKKAYSQLKKKPSVIEEINLNGLKVGAPVWGQKIKANLTLGSNTYKWDIYIAEMGDLCLLGLDFLHHHSINIKLSSHSIEIKGEEIFASLVKTPETSIKISRITLKKCTVVPPNSIKVVTGKLEHNLDGDVIL